MSRDLFINSPMSERAFHPPVTKSDVMAFHTLPGDEVEAVDLLVTDSVGQVFSLRISSSDGLGKTLVDGVAEGEETEPVFVIPGRTLSPDAIDLVLGSAPELLSKYLVSQDID